MEIIIVKNYKELSAVAAGLVIKQLKKKKRSVLGLATGTSSAGLYHELAKAYHKKEISFKEVKTFNLNEFVGLDDTDPGSLFRYMRNNFFDHVDLQPRNINMLDGRAKNLKHECSEFEKAIKLSKGIDLQILGLGPNGHIAFNEPGTGFKSRTHALILTASTRRNQLSSFGTLRGVPKQALTMGLATIMEAKKIILVVSGQGKAKILAKALRGKVRKKVPASILQRHPKVTVILDEAAAGELQKLAE